MVDNSIEKMAMAQEFSATQQAITLAEVGPEDVEFAQSVTTIYETARGAITGVGTLKQKRQARNQGREAIDRLSFEQTYQDFLGKENTRFYLQNDPEFKNVVDAKRDEHLERMHAIYSNTELSYKEQAARLQNENVRFETVKAKMLIDEDVKIFLLTSGSRYALSLIYPEYEQEVRAAYEQNNKALQQIVKNKGQSKEDLKKAKYEQAQVLLGDLAKATLVYTEKMANDEKFWSKLAHSPKCDARVWDAANNSFLMADLNLLYKEIEEEAGISIDARMDRDMKQDFETFSSMLHAIYNEKDVDAAMQQVMLQKVAYKGAVISSYRHRKSATGAVLGSSLWRY